VVGHRRQQLLRIVDDAALEVSGVRIQLRHLRRDGFDDSRIGMTHARHVVIGVEVSVAVRVDEV